MTTAFIFFVAFIGTLLSSLSGIGTGIITVPAWLSLGYSLPAAIATNKIAAVLWVPIPARAFLKSRQVEWRLIGPMAIMGLIGAWVGAEVTISVNEHILRRILGGVIIFLSVWNFRNKQLGLTERQPVKGRNLLLPLVSFPLGFYEGFFGTGNGIFSTLAFVKLRGFDLIRAMGHYYCLAFPWCLFAALFYAKHNFIDLGLVIPASAGSLIGSFAGAKLAMRGGTMLIKKTFIACGLFFGAMLLFEVL